MLRGEYTFLSMLEKRSWIKNFAKKESGRRGWKSGKAGMKNTPQKQEGQEVFTFLPFQPVLP